MGIRAVHAALLDALDCALTVPEEPEPDWLDIAFGLAMVAGCVVYLSMKFGL